MKEAEEKGMAEVQGKTPINKLFLKWERILVLYVS